MDFSFLLKSCNFLNRLELGTNYLFAFCFKGCSHDTSALEMLRNAEKKGQASIVFM